MLSQTKCIPIIQENQFKNVFENAFSIINYLHHLETNKNHKGKYCKLTKSRNIGQSFGLFSRL